MSDIRKSYPPRTEDQRREVRNFAESAPFARDSWHDLKWLYKQAEAARDISLLAIILRRIDRAPMPWSWFGSPGDIHELRFENQGINAIAVCGDRIALSDDHHLFLCKGRDRPALLGRYALPASKILGWHGDHLIATLGDRGIQVLDLADYAKPTKVGELLFDVAHVQFLASCDERVYLRADQRLIILDLSDPTRPTILFQNNVARPYCGSWAVYRHFVYIAGGGFRILDCRKPRKPRQRRATHSFWGYGALRVAQDKLLFNHEAYDLSDPAKPKKLKELPDLREERSYMAAAWGLRVAAGYHPSPETMGYMKRRGRRLLRTLAKDSPADFADLASRLLRGVDANWELATQWIIADLLYGGGKRLKQARHGRGPVSLDGPEPPGAELRSPQAWRESPVSALLVLVAPQVPWQLRDAMYRILAKSADLPALLLDETVISREERLHFLGQLFDAPSPRLVHLACRIIGDLTLDETLQAAAWFFAGREPEQGNSPKVAKALCTCLGRHPTPSATRVPRAAERLLKRPDQVVPAQLLPGIGRLLWSPHAEVVALGYVGARSMPAKHFYELGHQISELPADEREAPLAAMLAMASGVRLRKRWFDHMICDDSAWLRGAGWALAEVATREGRVLFATWTDVLNSYAARPITETACTHPAALRILASLWQEMGGCNRVICKLLDVAPNTLECLKALESIASQITLNEAGVRALTSRGGNWCRSMGWRVLVASATRPRLIIQRIERLFASSDDVIALFREARVLAFLREQEEGEYLQRLLRERPAELAELPDTAVAAIIGALPPSDFVSLAGACDDAAWERLAGGGLTAMSKHWVAMDLWRALEADMSPKASERLLDDGRFCDRLRDLNSDEVLRLSNPAFESALMAWIAAHETRFRANSAIFRRAACHRLPEIRAWALARVGSMNLPFALALMECGLPESVAAARVGSMPWSQAVRQKATPSLRCSTARTATFRFLVAPSCKRALARHRKRCSNSASTPTHACANSSPRSLPRIRRQPQSRATLIVGSYARAGAAGA